MRAAVIPEKLPRDASHRKIMSMTDVQQWLNSIDLGQYADAFEENAIGWDLFEELTDEDLRTIGIAALGIASDC